MNTLGSQDNVTIGLESTLQPATLEAGGRLVVRSLTIEANTTLGNRSHVSGGCCVPPDITLPPLTSVVPGRPHLSMRNPSTASRHAKWGNTLPVLKSITALLVMIIDGYATVPLVAAVEALNTGVNKLTPVGVSGGGGGSISPASLLFWIGIIPIGFVVLPESYFLCVVLIKRLILGKPRLGPDGLPLMETLWDELRHDTLGRFMDNPLMKMSGLTWTGTIVSKLHFMALGAKIGHQVMCSIPTCHEPDLLVLGDCAELGGDLCAEWGLHIEPYGAVTNSCVAEAGCRVERGAILVRAVPMSHALCSRLGHSRPSRKN